MTCRTDRFPKQGWCQIAVYRHPPCKTMFALASVMGARAGELMERIAKRSIGTIVPIGTEAAG